MYWTEGDTPVVMDSPSMGSFERLLTVTGLRGALASLPVTCRSFTESLTVDCGPPFGGIMLAREAVEAEVVINLPKFKTHAQMLLTLGVKNLFGCCVGYRKVEWHLRAGIDRDLFARLLVAIARRLAPAVTLLDGILALEGEGPGRRGHPISLGLLIGADDPLAMDRVIARLLGLPESRFPILKVAAADGILPQSINLESTIEKIGNFRLPPMEPGLTVGGTAMKVVRRYLLARPMVDQERCRLCLDCVKVCPVHAITVKGKEIVIAYDQCIRCYCCLEICPLGAMAKTEGRAAQAVRYVMEHFFP